MSPKEIAEALLFFNPSLTIKQAWNHYTKIFLVKYKDILTGKLKAQKTTTCRTVIMVAQKYRWHMQVENSFQVMCDNNTGTLSDGRNFGEVFEYPPLGGDETCCIASEGHIHAVGGK